MLTLFWDEENGGLFMTGEDAEKLPFRSKDVHDGAIPSGNSVAAQNLLYLAELTGNRKLEEKAQQLFRAFGREIVDYPDITKTVPFVLEYQSINNQASA
jgi:uncharacterized protein YyaL (SSP411 family)